ncbi:hypothetical protein BDR22DRAFT_639213 [Usnea florida]
MRAALSLKMFWLLDAFFFIGAAGLTLPPNQEINAPDSLTTVSVNGSNPSDNQICTSSFIWIGSAGPPHEFEEDCYQAWQDFLTTDFTTYKHKRFEFSQLGLTDAWPGIPKMTTPRRYIRNSCTIALVTIAEVPGGVLPMEPPGPFPRSDLGSFSDFRRPIIAVRGNCVIRRQLVGWAVTGLHRDMAVLMYRTNAPIEKMLPRGTNPSNYLNATTEVVGGTA